MTKTNGNCFDLKKDPEQLKSVYNKDEYEDIQKEIKRKLRDLQKKYKIEIPNN